MAFTFLPQALDGVVLIVPHVHQDARGWFLERYRLSEFAAAGIADPFVQENHSVSALGVLRGIHYQLAPHAQGKLVWVTQGSVWDVSVDLRRNSASYGRWCAMELSAENKRMLYMPPGFGHGFLALEDETHVHYSCTQEYAPHAERGIRWDDPDLAIDWPTRQVTLSEKDARLPRLTEAAAIETSCP